MEGSVLQSWKLKHNSLNWWSNGGNHPRITIAAIVLQLTSYLWKKNIFYKHLTNLQGSFWYDSTETMVATADSGLELSEVLTGSCDLWPHPLFEVSYDGHSVKPH